MKKGTIYFLIAGVIALLSACGAKIQTYSLNEEYATSLHIEGSSIDKEDKTEKVEDKVELAGVPALNFYGGDLKRGGIWWAGKGIFLEKGDVFIFDAENVGPDSIPFGATFPPLDMQTVKLVVKISARAEAKDTVANPTPTLYLQLEDANGAKADAKKPFQVIENSKEFKDYFFDLKDVFVQSMPKRKVNGTFINSIKFFINQGQAGYTGQIYIREIKVVPVPAGN